MGNASSSLDSCVKTLLYYKALKTSKYNPNHYKGSLRPTHPQCPSVLTIDHQSIIPDNPGPKCP